MALPGMKCRHFWRLRGLKGDAAAFHTSLSSWRRGVSEVGHSVRSVCAQNDRQPARSLYATCGQSALVTVRPLPTTPFSVSGLPTWVPTQPSASTNPLVSGQRTLPFTARHYCHSSKKTLSASNACTLRCGKAWTCAITQTGGTSTPAELGLMSSQTGTSGISQSARMLVMNEVRPPLARGQSGFMTEKKWGGATSVPSAMSHLLSRHQSAAGMGWGRRHYTADAHKSVSPLTVKRPLRKKVAKGPQQDVDQGDNVVAYAAAEELNLTQLREALVTQGLYTICPLPIDAQDALHVQAKYTVDGKKREIFFFRDGSAVFWSMPEVERKEALKFIRKHDIGRYPPSLILREKEEMDLRYVCGPTGVSGDTLQLKEGQEEGHSTLEKYAFSNALAQSVKLAIWEASLETFVDSIEHVTEDLRDGQKIGMSRREVLRKTGELFALRHLINLSSDLLDTPDFYWDRAVLEPLYMAVCNHLDVSRRTKVMNEKLSHCCELTELLSSHLNDVHHTRLEVMIIILILVEVVFEIIHYIERYVDAPMPSEGPSLLTSDPATQASVAPSSGSL